MILVFTIAVIGCDNGVTNNSSGITLVCFGDSLTAGYGAGGILTLKEDKSKSYPAYLQKKVNAHNVHVVNAGVSGDTTAQGLARVDRDVLSKNPQIVIILLGANDFLKPILDRNSTNTIPVNETQANLQSIINKVNNGNRKIYLAKFYTHKMIEDSPILSPLIDPAVIAGYDAMFDVLAASSNNVTLINDIWTGVWGIWPVSPTMSDPIHPNALGYEIMAGHFYNALKPYL